MDKKIKIFILATPSKKKQKKNHENLRGPPPNATFPKLLRH